MPIRLWPRLWSLLRLKDADEQIDDYAVRTDWSRSHGEINYSSFVYFDVDGDGCYGSSDRPFGGIRVRLMKDGQVIASARTNNNGFANFRSSSSSRSAPICRSGTYQFVVSVPDAFAVTSRNSTQSMEFKPRPGSISGIGSDEMLQPVGLTPDKVIKGRLPKNAKLSITALNGTLLVDEKQYASQTAFLYRVPAASDAVVFSIGGWTRRTQLSCYPIDLGLLDPQRGSLEPSRKTETIDFDSLNPRGLRKIPSGYADLRWFNLNAMTRDFTKNGQGYVNGNTSGDHIAYTSSGYPALVYSDTPFDFIGVHLSVAWLKAEGETAIIESWRGDELIAKDRVTLSALSPVFYNPGLPNITRIRLATDHYWQMVLDDLVMAR